MSENTGATTGFDVILNALHKRDEQAGAVCRTIGALDFDVERLGEYTPTTLRNIIKRVHNELHAAYPNLSTHVPVPEPTPDPTPMGSRTCRHGTYVSLCAVCWPQ